RGAAAGNDRRDLRGRFVVRVVRDRPPPHPAGKLAAVGLSLRRLSAVAKDRRPRRGRDGRGMAGELDLGARTDGGERVTPLAGRTALVTGGAKRVGAVIASAIEAAGARVIVTSRSAPLPADLSTRDG